MCEYAGFPKPVIKWTVNGREVNHGNKRFHLAETKKYSVLEIKNVQRQDHGTVQCKAVNIMGQDQKDARLTIHGMLFSNTLLT